MKEAFVLRGATADGCAFFSADMLWRTGFVAPDPFWLIEIDGRRFFLAGSLELGRARKEASIDEAFNLFHYIDLARKKRVAQQAGSFNSGTEAESGGILVFLKEQGVTRVTVPSWIPYEIALALQQEYTLNMRHEPLYPERTIKSPFEIEEIKKAQTAVENAVAKAMAFLERCLITTVSEPYIVTSGRHIKDYLHATVVTSEMLRSIIDNSLWKQGYKPDHTIVACGLQAADPHCKGFGPLRPYQPIVMDVFPMSRETHIFADMTRTVFKGEPSQELTRMYETVLASQEGAIQQIRQGVDGKDIHEWVVRYLDASGYPTTTGDNPEGFFHGLGHSLGLEIHEPPSLNRTSYILRIGNVVTVEPGLYYSRARDHVPAAGIRIEDMVLVTEDGCENLTKFPKDLASMIIA